MQSAGGTQISMVEKWLPMISSYASLYEDAKFSGKRHGAGSPLVKPVTLP